MVGSCISLMLRVGLILALAAAVWRFVEPKTQAARIFRAALLVLGLLCVLAMVRLAGQ